jgi:hypothetical protein
LKKRNEPKKKITNRTRNETEKTEKSEKNSEMKRIEFTSLEVMILKIILICCVFVDLAGEDCTEKIRKNYQLVFSF